MDALALAAALINHRRNCASCTHANHEPRVDDHRRCREGRALASDYVATLRAEREAFKAKQART